MAINQIPPQYLPLVRAWIPRLLAATKGGFDVGGGIKTKLFGIPYPKIAGPDLVFDLGFAEVVTRNPMVMAWITGQVVDLGAHKLVFPDAIPKLVPAPNGALELQWQEKPRIADSFITKFLGTKIDRVLIYANRIEMMLERGPDQVWEWD